MVQPFDVLSTQPRVGDLACLDALLSATFLHCFSMPLVPSQAMSDHSAEQQDFGCAPKEKPASHVGPTVCPCVSAVLVTHPRWHIVQP